MSDTAIYEVPRVTLGWRMRMAMEHAGIKRDQMAARMGVTPGTVTRWSHDIGSPPRAIYLEKWAEITGVPLAWLTGNTWNASGGDTHRLADALAA